MRSREEEISFIRSVVADPGDDAPRLGYADWLDERASEAGQPIPCPRAELIRLQIFIETAPVCTGEDGCVCGDVADASNRVKWLANDHHESFRRVDCPSCDAPGGCSRCEAFSDVGGLTWHIDPIQSGYPNYGWAHRVDFVRGFPGRVYVTMNEMMVEDVKPHEWIRRVCAYHPIERIVIADRKPLRWSSDPGASSCGSSRPGAWINTDHMEPIPRNRNVSAQIPDVLWRRLGSGAIRVVAVSNVYARYYSEDDAIDALSRAAADFVNTEVHGIR